jgi:hypothetical protein
MKETQKKSWACNLIYINVNGSISESSEFSHQISLFYFKMLKNTNVLIKAFHKPFTKLAHMCYIRHNTASHVVTIVQNIEHNCNIYMNKAYHLPVKVLSEYTK